MAETYYRIKLSTLTEIGDAIRAKNGATGDIAVTSLATSILDLSPADGAEEWDGTGVVIAPIEPVEPNTFTINGTSYQMENRMTWYAWTRSDYNTDGFSCASENDYVYEAESTNRVTDAEGNDVLGTTYIVEGGTYLIKEVVSLITFTIDGEEYQAEDGMNWYQWVQSDYAPDSYSCSSEDSQVNPSGDTYIVDRDNEEVLGRELIISGAVYSIEEAPTTEDELAGTWVLNTTISTNGNESYYELVGNFPIVADGYHEDVTVSTTNSVRFYINAPSDYNYKAGYSDNNHWTQDVQFYGDGSSYYCPLGNIWGEAMDESWYWVDANSANGILLRTFTITSKLSEVTNGDELLAWLRANATKQGAANLISFTIEGKTYQAESGMTWGEWVASDYNTSTYALSGSTVYNGHGSWVQLNGQSCVDTDFIIAGATYVHVYASGSN